MSETKNYGLYLESDGNTRFQDWRERMNGETDSNMVKIDAALGEKADKTYVKRAFVSDVEPRNISDGETWLMLMENNVQTAQSVQISHCIGITLYADQWTDRMQTISVAGIGVDTNGVIGLSPNTPTAQREAVKEAEIYLTAQRENALTFTVDGEAPAVDIPLNLMIFA